MSNKGMDRINTAIGDFGGLLRDYRLEHHLSLQDLSEIVGYSPSYIWRIEKNKRFPELETRMKILISLWSMEDIYMYLQEIVSKESNAG
ncbi:helix-turn-helix domain-containing protein [Radiobacillus deserti]|uniref:Helix-turn-helix transcriptional regulator n=1 Tax=Radiobacillus deserti TaxID=2594883 RepID=A0A516KKQ8_9BACI|nr:helix-turn-helix transcriptional regulator [Radiobacillus deserti]QDP41979.1 helix-turn-helix transcriptional regulator [Radiobacillus deserti]